ncbi:MAG: alpha/beta hydrolase-fold protein [Opitutaceae bacterium]|nr:alpha/beta hydrolase-fold protein [Opitutaceae bacterium]
MKHDRHLTPLLEGVSFASAAMGYDKKVWLFGPQNPGDVVKVHVFLDAEIYLKRVGALGVLEEFCRSAGSVSSAYAFVSHGTMAERNRESLFHRPFCEFLCRELVPQLVSRTGMSERCSPGLLCGLSLTGLASVMVAVYFPDVYPLIAAQSGAYWPEDGRILRELENLHGSEAFYFDVGSEETDREGEIWSQMEGVKAVVDALRKQGRRSEFSVFEGGHDSDAWRRSLPAVLHWAQKSGI